MNNFRYTPFCIRCLDIIKPHFIQAAAEILELRSNVLFAVVDAHDEKDMKKRFEIDRYSYTLTVPQATVLTFK